MFCRSVFGNIYVFTSVFVLFIVFDYLNGLKVIHHRANNGVNPRRVVKTSSLWKGGNFFPSSNIDDEDDDLDSNDYTTYSSDQSVERQSRIVLSRSQQQVGPGQHFRRFYDQTAPDSASGSFYPTATKTPPSSLGSSSQRQIRVYLKNLTVYTGDLVRLHCPYAHPEVPGFSNPDHYLSTKTVIWTHELSSPKLLSNDAELFIKSARFRLESAEPFIASSSNEHISNKFESKNSHNSNDLALLSSSMKKHFILAICPSRVHDSGWYSCTVVKKHLNDPSVKYYTYLNVLAAETEAETSNDDDDASYDDEYEDEYGDFEEICRDKEIVHEATSHFDNDMNKSSTTLSVKETDDMKNISLKRQIDTRANNTSTSTTTNNTPLNTTYLLVLNTSQIEDPLAEYASSIAVASSADNNNTITNNDLTERVSTHPRHLNETEFASFQLNCIYTGPRFADVRLVWLKNEKILSQQVDDSVQQPQQQPPIQQTPAGVAVAQLHPRRYFTLNYKQNYTSIGVLKFSYGLVKDSGVYRCVALHDTDDSVRLALNDTSYLVVNKDAFGTADSLAKYGSSLERDFLINGQNPLVVENFIVYMILAVCLKFFV